jgi:hypothetical protein
MGCGLSGRGAKLGGEIYTVERNKFRPFVTESGRFVKQPFPRDAESGYLPS